MRYLAAFLLLFVLFSDADVHCPEHTYASCFWTGKSKPTSDGNQLRQYKCSCGDIVWQVYF